MRQVQGIAEHAQKAFSEHNYLDAVNAFDMARSMLDEGLSRKDYGAYAELRRELRRLERWHWRPMRAAALPLGTDPYTISVKFDCNLETSTTAP